MTTKSTLTEIRSKPLSQDTHSCWSCGAMRAAHFCESCGKVQPPVPVDYFTFFGLPRKLNVDVSALEKEFLRTEPQAFILILNARAGKQRAGMEPGTEFPAQRRLSHAERSRSSAREYLLHLEGVELEEQSKSATEQARATGEVKKQIVPPDLLEEVFELNMQLEELRMNKKMGEDDPALIAEIGKQKQSLEAKHEALLQELKTHWNDWDKLIDTSSAASEERSRVTAKMVDVLNRRNYIRNLVRDVNATLESEVKI